MEQRGPQAAVGRSTEDALQRFLMALRAGAEAALASLFAKDAVSLSDGGGEFSAARVVLVGAERVARVYLGILKKASRVERLVFRVLNGVPAIVAERSAHAAHAGEALRFVMGCEVDAEGRISRLYSVLATPKLVRVSPVAG